MTNFKSFLRTLHPQLSVGFCLCLAVGAWCVWCPDAVARRELLTAEDKARLQRAERVHLDGLALTDRGAADPAVIAQAVTSRLHTLGYVVVLDAAEPHDVTVKIKCEEHKTWEGTARSGGDADTPGSISRLWKGPACQISYRLEGVRSDWRHEVRGTVTDASSPGPTDNPGAAALEQLATALTQDPFPLLLTAEWGQSARLLTLLTKPDTDPSQKETLISLLGNMGTPDALPALSQSLHDPDLRVAKAAAVAIGNIGHADGIPMLLTTFKKTDQPELHLATAQGLGRLAPLHPNADLVPELVAALPQAAVPVQTEIVRALGTTADRRSLDALKKLNRDIQARTAGDPTPDIRALKKALGIALDQFSNTHGSDE